MPIFCFKIKEKYDTIYIKYILELSCSDTANSSGFMSNAVGLSRFMFSCVIELILYCAYCDRFYFQLSKDVKLQTYSSFKKWKFFLVTFCLASFGPPPQTMRNSSLNISLQLLLLIRRDK